MQPVPSFGTATEYLLWLPETVLTKICIVSSGSELALLILEMLDVRRMVAVVVVSSGCMVWRERAVG
jgi:hypothetical protein